MGDPNVRRSPPSVHVGTLRRGGGRDGGSRDTGRGRVGRRAARGGLPHRQGREPAGLRVLERRRRLRARRPVPAHGLPAAPGHRRGGAASPATGTTPASTSSPAARSIPGPTTSARYPVEIDDGRAGGRRRARRRARPRYLHHRLEEGLEQGITLVIAKAVLGLLDAGVRAERDRADRRRLRHPLPRDRLGRGPHRAHRHGQRAPALDDADRGLALVQGLAFVVA